MPATSGAIKQGRAFIELFAEDSKLRRGLAAGMAKVKAFGASVNRAGGALGGGIMSGMKAVSKMAKLASWGAAAAAGGLILAARAFANADRSLLSPEQAAAADAMKASFKALSQTFFEANAAIMTRLQPAISAVIDIVRIGVKAVADWIDKNKELVTSVTDWIGGIRDALSAGDIKLAGEILWAGLKSAWQAGIVAIETVWNKWGTNFQQAAIEAFYGVLQTANDVWAEMRIGIADITSYLAEKFKDAALSASSIIDTLRNRWGDKSGLVESAKAFAGGMANIGIKENTGSQKRTIEADRDKRSADLVDQQRIASEGIAKQNADALAAAQAELERRKAEQKTLLDRARAGAQDIPGKAAGSAAMKTAVAGTFSAVAARGLAAGSNSPEAKTAKATEATAKNTKELVRKIGDMVADGGSLNWIA